tara:strand:- start:21 stop:422 length:402 start_codon:yes stop_codon:yes gene_type:complete
MVKVRQERPSVALTAVVRLTNSVQMDNGPIPIDASIRTFAQMAPVKMGRQYAVSITKVFSLRVAQMDNGVIQTTAQGLMSVPMACLEIPTLSVRPVLSSNAPKCALMANMLRQAVGLERILRSRAMKTEPSCK